MLGKIGLAFLGNLKTIIIFLAGIFILWRMVWNIQIATTEKTPTPVRIDHWDTDYHGQQWLKLSGIAAPEIGNVTGTTAFVPVVPSNYKPGDPIHAVIITMPQREAKFSGPIVVEGVLSPSPWDVQGAMPGNKFAPDVVCLNENTTPDGLDAFTWIEAIVGLLFTGLGGYRLWKEFWQGKGEL